MRYCCVRFSTAAVVSTAIVAPTTVYCQRATNSPTFVVTHHTLLFVEPVSFLSIQQSSPPKFYTGRQNTKNVTTALALQRPHWEGIEGVNFSAGKRLQTVWRQAEMRTPTCCSKASQQGMRWDRDRDDAVTLITWLITLTFGIRPFGRRCHYTKCALSFWPTVLVNFDLFWAENWQTGYSCPSNIHAKFGLLYPFGLELWARMGQDRRADRRTDVQDTLCGL